MSGPHLRALDGGTVTLDGADVAALRARLGGALLEPGDPGWDDAVLVWNAMAASTPALVARPGSAAEVAAVVDFARERGVLLSVKGGGHHIAGIALAEGALTMDLSRIREVRVDPGARLVDVGAGCVLGDVDAATQEHGLATVMGIASEVGVAGLTLGGGFGYLARRFGWAVDNLVEVEIVTADGRVRVAGRESEPELFWAVRGAGANMGVVTRFTYRLHEVGPEVTGGLALWPAERVDEVLATYREVTERAPRELTMATVIRLAPPAPFVPPEWHGKPVVALLVCHSGADPEADLAPVRALGDPVADLVVRRPYTQQQQVLDGMQPKGARYYWKTEFVGGLSDKFLEAYRDAALRVPPGMSESVLFQLGGAIGDRAPDDGVVGNRDARYVTGFAGQWRPGQDDAPYVAWARQSWESIRPFSTGGNYVNFQAAEDDGTRTADAYGPNFARLRRAKAAYDPGNLFRVNRNVPPA